MDAYIFYFFLATGPRSFSYELIFFSFLSATVYKSVVLEATHCVQTAGRCRGACARMPMRHLRLKSHGRGSLTRDFLKHEYASVRFRLRCSARAASSRASPRATALMQLDESSRAAGILPSGAMLDGSCASGRRGVRRGRRTAAVPEAIVAAPFYACLRPPCLTFACVLAYPAPPRSCVGRPAGARLRCGPASLVRVVMPNELGNRSDR